MKSLTEFISEASINAKKRNVSFAKKMFTKGGQNGGVGAFAILTAENPDSTETDRKTNKEYLTKMKKLFKQAGYIWVTVEGHYGGNPEHSLMVFNIDRETAARYSGKFEQTSFFYCTAGDKSPVCEYWQKTNEREPYHEKKNPYELINKTDIVHNAKNAEDFYTVIGGDYKFSIDDSVFNKISEAIYNAATVIAESDSSKNQSVDDILDWATNRVGQYSWHLRKKIYEGIDDAMKEVED